MRVCDLFMDRVLVLLLLPNFCLQSVLVGFGVKTVVMDSISVVLNSPFLDQLFVKKKPHSSNNTNN